MIKVSRQDATSQRTDWQSFISESVEKCVEKINDTEAVLRELFAEDPFDINPYECDVAFISVINCIYYDIFVNCPKEAWESCKQGFKRVIIDFNGTDKLQLWRVMTGKSM